MIKYMREFTRRGEKNDKRKKNEEEIRGKRGNRSEKREENAEKGR